MKPFAGFQCKAVVVVPTDMVCSQCQEMSLYQTQITFSYGGINYNCLGLGVSAASFCSGGRRGKRGDFVCQSFCIDVVDIALCVTLILLLVLTF